MGEIQKNRRLAISGTKIRGSESGATHYCSWSERGMRENREPVVGGNKERIPQSWGKPVEEKGVCAFHLAHGGLLLNALVTAGVFSVL